MKTMLWLGAMTAAAVGLAGCGEMREALHPSTVASTSPGAKVCRYHDEQILGAQKVCTYDCSGSLVSTTVLGSQTCAQTSAYP